MPHHDFSLISINWAALG